MGRPKALLPWGDKTLIEARVEVLLATGQPVLVVLGADADQILPVLKPYPIHPVIHSGWLRGMGSSIGFGIARLEELFPDAAGVLIALVDQPLVTAAHFFTLHRSHEPGHILVSQGPDGRQGVPTLFDKFCFSELKTLDGDSGARSVLRLHPAAILPIESGDQLEDMDTWSDYMRLRNSQFP